MLPRLLGALSLAAVASLAWLPVIAAYAACLVAALLLASAIALRRGPPAWLAFALGVAAMLANTRLMASADTLGAVPLGMSMLRERRLTVDSLAPHHAEGRTDLIPHRGRFASKYPLVTPLLATPVLLPAAISGAKLDAPLANALQKLAAAVLAAAALALTVAAMPGHKFAAAAVLLFGTAFLPILGQALWSHTGAALCLAAGLAALVRMAPGAPRAAAVGLCAGLSVATRPQDALLALGLLVALAVEDRRAIPAALAAAALPVLGVLAYQAAMFGHPLATGYAGEARHGWRSEGAAASLAGLLVSPGRGLLLYSPVLAPALLGLFRVRAALAAAVVAQIALLSFWHAWDGGFSAGPRMLSAALPFLGLGLAEAVRFVSPWIVGPLAALSIAANALLAYAVFPPAPRALVFDLREGPWSPLAHPFVALFKR